MGARAAMFGPRFAKGKDLRANRRVVEPTGQGLFDHTNATLGTHTPSGNHEEASFSVCRGLGNKTYKRCVGLRAGVPMQIKPPIDRNLAAA